MAIEIELKAHVVEVEAIKRLLFEKAAFLWTFDKEDSYWVQEARAGGEPGHYLGSAENTGPRFRLRREKLTFPDGSEKTSCLLTYKTKQVRDGIEINDEKEFEVSSRSGRTEQVFKEFLLSAGLKPDISKRKRGWAFSREETNAELCEVETLGWFIELEIILDDADSGEDSYAESRSRLLGFLDSLGIEKKAIESRFYSEMLKESGISS